MDKKFTFQGHTFDDEKQLIAAKKEAEAVEYLRSKTDCGNMNNLRKLYDRILDRDMMETVIGNNKCTAHFFFGHIGIQDIPLLL